MIALLTESAYSLDTSSVSASLIALLTESAYSLDTSSVSASLIALLTESAFANTSSEFAFTTSVYIQEALEAIDELSCIVDFVSSINEAGDAEHYSVGFIQQHYIANLERQIAVANVKRLFEIIESRLSSVPHQTRLTVI